MPNIENRLILRRIVIDLNTEQTVGSFAFLREKNIFGLEFLKFFGKCEALFVILVR